MPDMFASFAVLKPFLSRTPDMTERVLTTSQFDFSDLQQSVSRRSMVKQTYPEQTVKVRLSGADWNETFL